MADQISPKPMQLFVRLLDGKSITLNFSTPLAYGDQIKQRIFEKTKIPIGLQRLITGRYQISDRSSISQPDTTVNLVLSLRGGKGGFGSLLRGAATKAGQKKTNNFDACRDMSGRRLRHVNAEKKLEEWKEGEVDRKLEKLANDFLKNQAKKVKQGAGNGATQKYVEKYRKDSDKCMEAVELALEESFKNGKRKGKMMDLQSDKSKRLKIWKGKRAVEDSDSDDSSDEEDDKSNIDESSSSVMAGARDGESSGKASCNSGSEEEKETIVHQCSDSPAVAIVDGSVEKEKSSVDAEKNQVEIACETSVTINKVAVMNQSNDSEVKSEGETESVDGAMCCKSAEPLNFDDFSSATDMEVMGMERLKTELQSRGLKCGGTLQERAARLFLLKSTPLDKLPKKLLAKK